jgi:plastocyanin
VPSIVSRGRFWVWAGVGLVVIGAIAVARMIYVQGELDPGDPISGVTDVDVRDNEFEPAAIQIEAGQTVTWTWSGNEDHNVVGDGLESETQSSGTHAFAFTEPGTYSYECTLHFFMSGEVVVQ